MLAMSRALTGHWGKDFFKEFLRISVPIILTNLMTSSLHIIDNIMVGSLGDIELAGVAQANQLAFVLRLTLFGVGGGCAIFSSQYWGNRDVPGVRRTMGISLVSSLAFGALAASAALLAPRAVIRIYTPDPLVIQSGMAYLRITGVSYLAIAASTVYNAANRSTEKVRLNMVAALCAILANTFLNWCLIFGNLGFPRMGVRGAALATTIAAFAELGILVGWTYLKKYPAAARIAEMKIPGRSFARRYYKVAFPVMLNEGIWSLGVSVYYAVYGRMSTQAVAAMNVFSTVDQVLMAAIFGVMNATAVMVGKRIGAGREQEAVDCSRRMLVVSAAIGIPLGLLLFLLRGSVVSIFNISAEAKEMAFQVMGAASLLIWVRAFNSTNIVGVLRAGGDSVFSLLVEVIGVWLVGIPLAMLGGLVLQLPLPIVYLMIQSEEVLKSIVGVLRFRSRKWVNNLTAGGG